MTKSAIQVELNRFFQVLNQTAVPQREVTAAAFCKARMKFSASAFIDLNKQALDQFYQQSKPDLGKWLGFRVLAVDGTKYHLPDEPDVIERFGTSFNQFSQPISMAMGSVLYDVFTKLVIDARLYPYASSEREAALDHLDASDEGDLIVYDRGYPSFWLSAAHREHARPWCMRVTETFNCEVIQFLDSGKKQQIVDFYPNHKAARKCQESGFSDAPMKVRLMRVRTKGKGYVLMTSLLDNSSYPAKAFADLYHARWQVEESYKKQKSWLEIENFSGKSVLSVEQDFHAKILSLNLVSMMSFVAESLSSGSSKRRHQYQINFAQALSSMKDTLIRCLFGHLSLNQWLILLQTLAKATSPVRANRHFRRDKRGTSRLKHKPNYKRAM